MSASKLIFVATSNFGFVKSAYSFGMRPSVEHDPVLSEISDFTPCTHAQSSILHTKYTDKTDY